MESKLIPCLTPAFKVGVNPETAVANAAAAAKMFEIRVMAEVFMEQFIFQLSFGTL